jgi:hypothetical protein
MMNEFASTFPPGWFTRPGGLESGLDEVRHDSFE